MFVLNHITFTVSDLYHSMSYYNELFDCQPVALGENLAYYNVKGLWFCLNVEENVSHNTYTHIAFTTEDVKALANTLKQKGINYSFGRNRHPEEEPSIYLKDPDGQIIEFHEGSLETRLGHYKRHRSDIHIRGFL